MVGDNIFGTLSRKRIFSFSRLYLCPFLSHLPSNSFAMFFCFRVSLGRLCPLFGYLYRIFDRDLNLSLHEGILFTFNPPNKKFYSSLIPYRAGYSGQFFWHLDESAVASIPDRTDMGDHSSFLLPCRAF